MYIGGNRRTWALGNQLILQESPYLSPSERRWDEHNVLKHIQDLTQIPVQDVIFEWVDDTSTHFIIKRTITGISLNHIWCTLSDEEKEDYAKQTWDCLEQLRDLHQGSMSRVDLAPLYDPVLFGDLHPRPHGPFFTVDDFWATLVKPFAHKLSAAALERLRGEMPDPRPFTYTHGDLGLGNIIVNQGRVSGIIDWEWSGYFPSWWESTKLRRGSPLWIAPEWCNMLLDHMPATLHQRGYRFFKRFDAVRYYLMTDRTSVNTGLVDLELWKQGRDIVRDLEPNGQNNEENRDEEEESGSDSDDSNIDSDDYMTE